MKIKNDFPFYPFVKNFLLISSDILAFIISFVVALYLRKILPVLLNFMDFPVFAIEQYFSIAILMIFGVVFLVFIWNHLYQTRRDFWEELLIIWKSLLIACLVCYLFLFNFNNLLPFMSRVVLLLSFFSMALMIPLFRFGIKKILFTLSFWHTPTLIVCSKEDIQKAKHIASVFQQDFYLGLSPTGFFIDDYQEDFINIDNDTLPVYHKREQLPKNVTILIVGEIFNIDKALLSSFYGIYRKIYLIATTTAMGLTGGRDQYLFSHRLLIVKLDNKLNSLSAYFIKNTMDQIFGILFIFLFSPMLLIISIAIKTMSPGPVFYRQERVGKGAKIFKIWKFRTMYIDADQKLKDLLNSDLELKKEWETYFKLKKDPRITPIGTFLRKYSLDEFPQLFNVLTGEMSLVGPRPFVQGEIEELNTSLLPLYAQVKPGLTGLWQVSGRNDIDRLERMSIDVWYIQNWSLSLDILILLNTPIAVLTARGAS